MQLSEKGGIVKQYSTPMVYLVGSAAVSIQGGDNGGCDCGGDPPFLPHSDLTTTLEEE
jgi:hypothetical protein